MNFNLLYYKICSINKSLNRCHQMWFILHPMTLLCPSCHWTSHWSLHLHLCCPGSGGGGVCGPGEECDTGIRRAREGRRPDDGWCSLSSALTVNGVWWGLGAPPSSVRPKVLIRGPKPWRQEALSFRRQSRYKLSVDREKARESRCHRPSHRAAAGNLSDMGGRLLLSHLSRRWFSTSDTYSDFDWSSLFNGLFEG